MKTTTNLIRYFIIIWFFMIIVFTSNENGGLIQMAIKVIEELYKLGH